MSGEQLAENGESLPWPIREKEGEPKDCRHAESYSVVVRGVTLYRCAECHQSVQRST